MLKQSSMLKDTPSIMFKTIQFTKEVLYPKVISIVKKNLPYNAFCLLPENFLYAMILSDESWVRQLGLKTILQIRSHRAENPLAVEASKKVPEINWEADHWTRLINLQECSNLCEPAVTRSISDEEINSHMENDTKPELFQLPSHSQSVERSVKLVTEASTTVYGFENRHRSILTKLLSRECRPAFESKGYYHETYSNIF